MITKEIIKNKKTIKTEIYILKNIPITFLFLYNIGNDISIFVSKVLSIVGILLVI